MSNVTQSNLSDSQLDITNRPLVPVPKACNEWPVLSESEIEAKIAQLPRWRLLRATSQETSLKPEPPKLQMNFTAINFVEALGYLQRVGQISERHGHHPDLHLTGWNQVEIQIWTHSLGGLTDNDFNLANSIDTEASPVCSKKFLRENPEWAQA